MFSKPSLIADNPLGIVIQSVERPSGDTTVYAYTPAGRLESEVREGQVAHSRYYGYNLDGSRQWVLRDDAVNGLHWDMYSYDEVSGRLASVQDVWTGEVNGFAWNPEGTLARWEEPNSYARVFGYEEEGRLVRIERDYGNGDVQLAYEYGYNSDGVRVWKRDVLAGQEYRYVCRIGCGGVPMRVYNRAMSGGSWASVEDYLPAGNALGYNQNWQYRYSGGELLMMGATGEPSGYYPTDSNGLAVGQTPPVACVCYIFLQNLCAPIVDRACSGNEEPVLYVPQPSQPCGWNPSCLASCTAVALGAFWGCLTNCAGFWNVIKCIGFAGACAAVCIFAPGGLANPACIRCLQTIGKMCRKVIPCLIPCIGVGIGAFINCARLCYQCPPSELPYAPLH
jgi:hypothetical protein